MGSASHKADLDPHHWNTVIPTLWGDESGCTSLVCTGIAQTLWGDAAWSSALLPAAASGFFWPAGSSTLKKRYISSVPEPGPFSLAGAEAAPTPNDNKPVLRSRIRSLWSRNYLRPGAGAEIKYLFNKYLLKSVWRMLG